MLPAQRVKLPQLRLSIWQEAWLRRLAPLAVGPQPNNSGGAAFRFQRHLRYTSRGPSKSVSGGQFSTSLAAGFDHPEASPGGPCGTCGTSPRAVPGWDLGASPPGPPSVCGIPRGSSFLAAILVQFPTATDTPSSRQCLSSCRAGERGTVVDLLRKCGIGRTLVPYSNRPVLAMNRS